MPPMLWRRRFAIFIVGRFKLVVRSMNGRVKAASWRDYLGRRAAKRCAPRRSLSRIRNPDVIAHISGTLAQKIPGEIVVDVDGVGYQVFIPLNVFYRLPEIGAPVSLQIHTHVREDALQLFGFQDFGRKTDFFAVDRVSGIGPSLAFNILSGIAAEGLARALKEGDQSAPGRDSRGRQETCRAHDRRAQRQVRHFGADRRRERKARRRFAAFARCGFGAGQSRI